MQAVILAAGRSTRTYPLTSSRPKPLIPIWDRPLLEHQLAQLEGIVEEALLVTGYRKEQIEAHFGAEHRGIRLRYVEQKTQRGTADAVLAARPHVTERVLILNGDDFYHREDLSALAKRGRALLVTHAPDPQNRAVVTIEDDAVVDIVEKPTHPPKDSWCSVGGYCVEARDLDLLEDLPVSARGELELPDFVLRLIAATPVSPHRIQQFWLPLTYAWDVLTAMSFIWSDEKRAFDLGLAANGVPGHFPECSIEGPVWISEGVTMEKDVRIVGPAAIGPNCVLRRGAFIDRSALFERVQVGAGARVESSVLGADVQLGEGVRLEGQRGAELEVLVKDQKVVPELERMGSVLGDGNRIAADTVIAPGTLIPEASAPSPSPS